MQADLFKAVLAAVYVDSGFTLRAPAGVYAVKPLNPYALKNLYPV